jgi:hypothetical protein
MDGVPSMPTCPRCGEPLIPGSFAEQAHELHHALLDLRDATLSELGPVRRWIARRVWRA